MASVGMYRHVTSRNQGTFSKWRKDPGNEVAFGYVYASLSIIHDKSLKKREEKIEKRSL